MNKTLFGTLGVAVLVGLSPLSSYVHRAEGFGLGTLGSAGSAISNKNVSAIPNFTLNNGLPKWQKCRQKVILNTGNCTVLFIGESTERGWGATWSGGTANNAASTAWPVQVALGLRLDCDNNLVACINAQSNSFSGSGNVGNAATFAAYDTRVNVGTWTVGNVGTCFTDPVVGGCYFQSADTTSPFTFNPKNTTTYPSAPTVPTNVADVYSVSVNQVAPGVFGTLLINVNGGSTLGSINQNAAGTLTYTKTTVSTGSGAADNTWNATCSVTTLCIFDTIVLRNSAVSEASFINMAMGGATVVNWNKSGTVYNPLAAIQNVFQPDLCIIQDQGNDQDVGTPVSTTYKTNLTAIVTACQASGDALIVTSQPGSPLWPGGTSANSTLTCTGGVVTVTTSSPHSMITGNTPWVKIAGVTPSGYNGSYQVSITGASTFTYSLSCPAAETVPGTWALLIPPPDNQFSYVTAQRQVGAATGAPVYDWWSTMCGTVSGTGVSSTTSKPCWQAGMAQGYNDGYNGAAADVVHQGPPAYATEAARVAAILRM